MSDESIFAKAGRFLRSLSKNQLDKESWLEAFGPEDYYYCERDGKLLFHIDHAKDKSVLLSLPKNWGPTSTGEPITNEDLENIAGKLKKHFQSQGYSCTVEYFDPWKK